MDWEAIFKLFIIFFVAGAFVYFFYKNSQLDKKYFDKPTKNKV